MTKCRCRGCKRQHHFALVLCHPYTYFCFFIMGINCRSCVCVYKVSNNCFVTACTKACSQSGEHLQALRNSHFQQSDWLKCQGYECLHSLYSVWESYEVIAGLFLLLLVFVFLIFSFLFFVFFFLLLAKVSAAKKMKIYFICIYILSILLFSPRTSVWVYVLLNHSTCSRVSKDKVKTKTWFDLFTWW